MLKKLSLLGFASFFSGKSSFFSEFSPLQLLMGNRIFILYSWDIVNVMTVLIKNYEEWWHFGFVSFRWKRNMFSPLLLQQWQYLWLSSVVPYRENLVFSSQRNGSHLWQLSDTPFKITYHWPWQGREGKL